MAEQDSEVEKNLPPSERKLEQARESGSGLKAPDIMLVLSLSLVSLGLLVARDELFKAWLRLWRLDTYWSRASGLNLSQALADGGTVCAIVVGILLVSGLVSAFAAWALGGFIFSAQAISLDLTRLDPFKKIAQMFSSGGSQVWWPTLKGLSSLALMVLGVSIFVREVTDGASLLSATMKAAAPSLVAFLFYAILDLIIQIWQRNKSLGMSLQELKDEMKESEGDPMIKAKMRQLGRQRARARMMSAIATADVVVVNPEHYLVALKWDPKRAAAPVVVARARDLMALALRDKARALGVAVLESPPYARALWAATKLDAPAPPAFYESIAVLLAWAFAIKDGRPMADPVMVEPPKEVKGLSDA